MSDVAIKICGLITHETVQAAVDLNVDMIGFVFHGNSARMISPELAGDLIKNIPTHIKAVGVFSDPEDAWVEQVLSLAPLDYIQLHGHETVDRVAEIKTYYPLPIIKTLRLENENDFESILQYRQMAEILMLDAKSPQNVRVIATDDDALSFDWSILQEVEIPGPWMLSGGLNDENVAEALTVTHAPAINVSASLETAPGQKSITKMKSFVDEISFL